jgi:hypothetical protein
MSAADPALAEGCTRLREPSRRARTGQVLLGQEHSQPLRDRVPAAQRQGDRRRRRRLSGWGHRELVDNAEGVETARFLNGLGVAAFVLKYRLGREQGSPYKPQVHAREDGLRAMRLVRSRAEEWGIDPRRVGIMGFSAGGDVVSMVVYSPGAGESQRSLRGLGRLHHLLVLCLPQHWSRTSIRAGASVLASRRSIVRQILNRAGSRPG